MTTVLVVDDEPTIARVLRINLQARGYTVATAADGAGALAAMSHHHPDVVVLDLGLPDMEGLDVIRRIRSWAATPIIVLSAGDNESQKVLALDAGADDYVTKPFGMNELLARLRAATRRNLREPDRAVVSTDFFTVDLADKRATLHDGSVVRLTPTEWQLLEMLARHAGRLVSGHQLLREIWGPTHTSDTNYLRVYIAQLRRKLERDPANPLYLLTEPGLGYRLAVPALAS